MNTLTKQQVLYAVISEPSSIFMNPHCLYYYLIKQMFDSFARTLNSISICARTLAISFQLLTNHPEEYNLIHTYLNLIYVTRWPG